MDGGMKDRQAPCEKQALHQANHSSSHQCGKRRIENERAKGVKNRGCTTYLEISAREMHDVMKEMHDVMKEMS